MKQKDALLDVISDGSFELTSPFLTTGEVVRTVKLATAVLGSPYGVSDGFSAATVRNWQNRKLFWPYLQFEDLRRSLYSAVDILRLVTMQHLLDFKVPLELGSFTADRVIETLLDKEGDGNLNNDSHCLITITRPGTKNRESWVDEFMVVSPDFQQDPAIARDIVGFLRRKRQPSAHVLDWKYVAGVAIECTVEEWKRKIEKFNAKQPKGKK